MIVTEGQRVIADRYRLAAPIGSGGVGVVWRARDVLLDREVAVKEIVQPDALDETYQRTLSEARAAARIRHPGVAAVYDVISEAGRPYIVMELIEGRSLAQVIEAEGPLQLPRVADIGRQVLAALTAGHAAGVLHRDLKPANVLVTSSGRAVLTDFGIASMAGSPSVTQTGMVLGTPSYLAPERARGETATPASDMWSLGAMLYAAVSGQGPYDGYDGAQAAVAAIITQEPPVLPAGGSLARIIRAMMDRDPRRRPSAAQTALVLEEAADSAFPAEPPVTQPRPDEDWLATAPAATVPPAVTRREPLPPRRGRRRVVLMASAAAVTAAALVATTLTVLNRPAHRTAAHPGAAHPGVAFAAAGSPVPAAAEEFRVRAAVNADGSLELVARAADGALMAGHFTNGSWSGWADLPGGRVYTGVPAVARSRDGRLFAVARTASGRLAYLRQASPGSTSWDAPLALGSQLTSSDPAVIAWPDGHLEVFARLRDGGLGTVSQQTATASRWSDWTSLGGTLAGPPVVALNSGGDPEVFALGPQGTLVHEYYGSGSWQGWDTLPGGHVYAGVPAVGTNFDGRLEVFARTMSGALEHVWQLPGRPGRWGGPLVLISGIVSDPAVYSTVGGRIEAFAVAPDESVLHSWQNQVQAGTGWSTPASIGGHSAGVPVPVRAGGQSEVSVRRPDGTIAVDRQAASLGWSGWSSLGGSF